MMANNILQKMYIKELDPASPPYQVDDQVYKRFDQKNNLTVGRPNWDAEVQAFSKRSVETRVKKIETNQPGFGVRDYSLFLAGGGHRASARPSIPHSRPASTPASATLRCVVDETPEAVTAIDRKSRGW